MPFPIGESDSRTSISISKMSFVRNAVGKRDGIGGGTIVGGSKVSCSITNDVAFLENSAAGAGGAFVVANGTSFSREQA